MEHELENVKLASKWLTVKEAAIFYGSSYSSLSKLIKRHYETLGEEVIGGQQQGKLTYITKIGLMQLKNLANIRTRKDMVSFSGKKQIVSDLVESQTLEHQFSRLVGVVENLSKQVQSLQIKDQRHSLSNELLPAPTKEVPEMSNRAALNKFIRDVAQKSNRAYHVIFNELYSQFYYRYKINIVQRAAKQGMSVIEYAENYEHIDDLYALARKIYN